MGTEFFRRNAVCLFAACGLTLIQANFGSWQQAVGSDIERSLNYYSSQPSFALQPSSQEDDENVPESEQSEVATPPPVPLDAYPFLAGERPVRIARAPNMFGDFFARSGTLLINSQVNDVSFPSSVRGVVDFVTSSRSKVADNNRAIVTDRLFLTFNHFHNALNAEADLSSLMQNDARVSRRFSVDRYTIGFEKTLPGSFCSVEARMPFQGTYQFDAAIPASSIGVAGGKIGNLGVILKREFPASENLSVAAGLGVEFPTGSDFRGRALAELIVDPALNNSILFSVRNEAVHLQPFVGLTSTINDRLFVNAFLQLDLAANSQSVIVQGTTIGANRTLGKFTEQSFLYVDLGIGCWLYDRPAANWLRGVAAIVELHYSTTMQDADVVRGDFDDPTMFRTGNLTIANPSNRMDILNLTMGLDIEIARTNVRVAAVAPLRDNSVAAVGQMQSSDRIFDAEIQVQVNRRF